MAAPSVSICIPCFNAGEHLREAIDSALAQQGVTVEVLVYDDGSTDESPEIIRSYGSRIRVFGGSKLGGNPARNFLLEKAEGEWVQFLDADDGLLPGALLNKAALVANNPGCDLLYQPVVLRNGTEPVNLLKVYGAPSEENDPILDWIRTGLSQTGGLFWRKTALLEIGGWKADQPCAQDNELCLRAITQGLSIHASSECCAFYRVWTGASVCRKDPSHLVRERTKLLDQLLVHLNTEEKCHIHYEKAAGISSYSMARVLASYSSKASRAYAAERKRKGSFIIPSDKDLFSRLAALLGYEIAERIGSYFRQRKA